MKIEIICPDCNHILTDKFESDSCTITFGKSILDMECCYCGKYINISIIITAYQLATEVSIKKCSPDCHYTERYGFVHEGDCPNR